jgi:hypothetical protein
MKSAAKYNKPIEFWISTNPSDGIGGTYPTYQLVFADYASLIPKTEKRGTQEGQLVLAGYFEISMRFRPGVLISKSAIIKHNNDFYSIQSIVNDRDREYQLICISNDGIQEIFENSNPYSAAPTKKRVFSSAFSKAFA